MVDVAGLVKAVSGGSDKVTCAAEQELVRVVEAEFGVRVARPLTFLRALALRVAEVRELGERNVAFIEHSGPGKP